MKIAVNTRMLIPSRLEGIGNFTHESFRRIVPSHPEHEFIFIFDRPYDTSFVYGNNVTPIVIFPPARHPILTSYWNEIGVANVLRKHRPDVYVGTDGFFPISTNCKTLAVIHDLCFIHYPEDLPFLTSLYYRKMFPHFAKKATRIAAVSEFTKFDVIDKFNINENKFDVVYNGASDIFTPLPVEEITKTRKQFSNGQPYFLFVGAIHQRKNISNLLQAYNHFRKNNSSNVKMLLVGNRRWWTDEMESTFQSMEYKSDVIFTGRVTLEDLSKITASALAMTYVSNFEGFGIPIIEGMKAGIPVLTSNTSSMPEIAGQAALLCNPFNIESIADGMKQLAINEALRLELIHKGNIRQAEFSWNKTAVALWHTIEKTIGY